MNDGTVVAIYVAPAARAAMVERESVTAVPGKGLEGDRYFGSQGTFFKDKPTLPDKEVTLIEQEALEALAHEYRIQLGEHENRRNIVTSGIALNHLVGREFKIGTARLRGIRLCEPCDHLERLTGRKLNGLTHRGGLRAQVIKQGEIKKGDPIFATRERFSTEFLEFVNAIAGEDCKGGQKEKVETVGA
jgi:MOSC domain-containing protein YiiM